MRDQEQTAPVAGPQQAPAGLGAAMSGPQQGLNDIGGGEPASPEEQALYDKFVSMAMLHIYNDKVLPKIVDSLNDGDEPRRAIGQAAANVGYAVYTKAREAGQQIPGDIILNGGQEIVEALVEIWEKANGKDLPEGEADAAFYWAADTFRELVQSDGTLNKEAVEADMQTFKQMEADGSLQRMMQALQGQRQEQEGT